MSAFSRARFSRFVLEECEIVAVELEYQGEAAAPKAVTAPLGAEPRRQTPPRTTAARTWPTGSGCDRACGSCMLTIMGVIARTLEVMLARPTGTPSKRR